MSFFYDNLSEHPDCLQLEIAGKEINWLLNKKAFEKAKDEGIEISEFDEVDEDDVIGNLEALSQLIYVGTLPFDYDLNLEEIDEVMTPAVMVDLGPKLLAQFQGLTDEQVEEIVGNEQEGE